MWQKIIKNTFWLTSGEIIGRALRIILVLYAARVLGAADWGVFSYALSLAALFTILADIGIGAVLTRELVRNTENRERYLASSFFIKIIFLIITTVIIIFVTPLFTKFQLSQTLLMFIAGLVVADNLRILSGSINRATEQMHFEAFTNIFTQAVIVLFGIWILRSMPSAENLGISYLVGSGFGACFGLWTVRTYLKKFFAKFDRQTIQQILDAAWPFALMGLLGGIMLNTDIIMLGWLRTIEEIGYYSSAQKIVLTLYVLPTLIGAAAFPSWTRLANKNKAAFGELLEKALKVVFLIAIPITVGGLITGSEMINLFFGQEYAPASIAFKILLLSLVINYPSAILGNALFAYDQQKFFIIYGGIGAVSNIILNFLLIPQWGIAGAATATVVTQILSNMLSWRKMKQINNFSVLEKLWKIAIASVFMGIIALALQYWHITILISIPAAIIVYLAILYLLKESIIHDLKSFLYARSSN